MKVEEYKKVIAMAVENEIEAFDFYTAAGEKVQDANLKDIFKDLAEEEMKHRNFLQGLLSQVKPMRFDEAQDYKIAEAVAKPKLSIAMKPAEAIALAMKNEEEAMTMYAELARCSTDQEQKEMFEALSRMEKGTRSSLRVCTPIWPFRKSGKPESGLAGSSYVLPQVQQPFENSAGHDSALNHAPVFPESPSFGTASALKKFSRYLHWFRIRAGGPRVPVSVGHQTR